jgi:predicted dehydrogenase
MTRIGIIGFGFMGRIHLRSYLADGRAEIVAVADPRDDCLTRETPAGNIDARGGARFDLAGLKRHADYRDLLADSSVDAVSICSPTRQHVEVAIAALASGKHLLVEKPLGISSGEAMRVVEAARAHPKLVAMPAMCMRFWPAWRWLKEVIDDGRYGVVKSAAFTRLGSMPKWSNFYFDARESGGGILDLHIHDADFVRYCFGEPRSVRSAGYSQTTGEVDHVVTTYDFGGAPPLVTAEGGWSMRPGFQFVMRYTVNFERATATFDLHRQPQLQVHRSDEKEEHVELDAFDGWEGEIRYFLDCIEQRRSPSVVTLRDGAHAVRLIEAERESARSNRPVAWSASKGE